VNGADAHDAFQAALLDDDANQLYDRAPCGYLSTTPDGFITKVNQTFLTLTGLSREDLVGRRRFVDLLTPGGRIFHETHYAPMLRVQGRAGGIAMDLVKADGGRLSVLISSVLERDDAGNPVAVRAAVFDATDRRSYERELVRAKQAAEAAQARATALARTLQQVLIPREPPAIEGLEVAAAYRPAHAGDEVGGDFYDFFETATGDWVFAIGDVCGKGAEAAVVTALVRNALRAVALRPQQLTPLLETVNQVLLQHSERFATLALLWLRRTGPGWHATLSCAGHPLPVLVRPGAVPIFFGEPGSLVGAVDEASFGQQEYDLRPGEALLLYTDGVTEGRRNGEFFGDQRLLRAVAESTGSAEAMVARVLGDVLGFQAGDPTDDIAVLAVRVPY
jgi:sigma-B regulation protein RsbU (phosphoserine phosphatase)